MVSVCSHVINALPHASRSTIIVPLARFRKVSWVGIILDLLWPNF